MGETSTAKVQPEMKYKVDEAPVQDSPPEDGSITAKEDPDDSDDEDVQKGSKPVDVPFCIASRNTINPTSPGMANWDKLIMLVLVYTALVTPFEVSFLTPEFGVMFAINRVVDTVFIVDIFFTFFMDPGNNESLKTNGIPDHKKMAVAYIKSWFTVDVVSCLPFDLVSILMEGSSLEDLKFLRAMRLFRLIKLVRLLRATRMFDRWEDSMAINFAALSLVKSSAMVFLFSHWFACMWYITYYIEDAEENWITSGGFEKYNTFDSYIASWYFSVMTMSTIGYGDISPVTSAERIVACIMMLVGAGIYAYVVGSITSTVQTMEAGTRRYQELMDQLNQFLEENNVENDLRITARAYFRTRHQAGNLVDWRELLNEMSPDLREAIASHSHENWIGDSHFFWNAPDDFVGKAAALFTEVTYPCGERIIEIGQPVDAIYVIKRGVVCSRGKVIRKGALFGEDVVLDMEHNEDRRSSYVAMAFTFVQLQALDFNELYELLEEYPQVKRQTQRASLRQRFKSHVYSYASAVREMQGLKPLGIMPDRELIDHYRWKLAWLKMDGASGARFFKAIIKIQSVFRGSQGRKTVREKKESLLIQLDRKVQRTVKQTEGSLRMSIEAQGVTSSPDAPALLQRIMQTLEAMDKRLGQVEGRVCSETTILELSKRIESIDSKLGKAGGPPPLPPK